MRGDQRDDDQKHLGYWGFSIAVMLCCLIVGTLAYSQGQEIEKRQNYVDRYVQSAKEWAVTTCRQSDPRDSFDCIFEKAQSSTEAARAEQDLDVQQGMKFWATMMFLTALVSIPITVIGVWLVKRTLDATLEAVADTSKATDAMLEANKIAQRHFEFSIKPVLSAQISGPYANDVGATRMLEPGEHNRWVELKPTVEIRNWTDRPAIINSLTIGHLDEYDEYYRKVEVLNITLGRDEVHRMEVLGGLMMTRELKKKWQSSPPPIVGLIEYTDYVGNLYFLGFAFAPSNIHSKNFKRWGDKGFNFDFLATELPPDIRNLLERRERQRATNVAAMSAPRR